jgi:fructose 1,6-bisphosphatase
MQKVFEEMSHEEKLAFIAEKTKPLVSKEDAKKLVLDVFKDIGITKDFNLEKFNFHFNAIEAKLTQINLGDNMYALIALRVNDKVTVIEKNYWHYLYQDERVMHTFDLEEIFGVESE